MIRKTEEKEQRTMPEVNKWISVYLVEDEKFQRESIRKNVPWEENQIRYLGDSSDGELALPQILEKRPDILLTDIKMPFMDGLELANAVKQRIPDIKIIILSGYNEFDYAKKAIGIGVCEYLLKPVTASEILAAIAKIRPVIYKEQEEEDGKKEQLRKRQEMFFGILFSGFETDTNKMLEMAEQCGLKMTGVCYQVLYMEWNALQDIESFCEELYALEEGYAAGYSGRRVWFLVCGASKEALLYQTECLKEKLGDLCERYAVSRKIRMGVIVERIRDISKSFHSLYGEEKDEGMQLALKEMDSVWVLEEDVLRNFLENGLVDMAEIFWNSYREEIEKSMHSFIFRCYIYMEFALIIRKFTKAYHIELPEEMKQSDKLDLFIRTDQSAEEFISFAIRVCKQVMKLRDTMGTPQSPIDQAKKYIEAHFTEPDLSLGIVANKIGFSPNHFSSVFKEKIGVGFAEYLILLRIEEAKRLLVMTDLYTSEIGERVGYLNMNYFSMLFKRVAGCSPSRFRKENRKK